MKKLISILLILLMLLCTACTQSESQVEATEDSDIFEMVIAENETPQNSGITLLLDDGTVIYPNESAIKLANSEGAVVRYNGEPVTNYRCDINGLGARNSDSSLGWFSCETDFNGRLYVWTLDSIMYKLTIEVDGELAQFFIDGKNNPLYNITLGSPNIKPGMAGYFYGFGPAIGPSRVYYKGKKVTDYTASVRNPEYGTATKDSSGVLSFEYIKEADTCLTISVNGESRSYVYHTNSSARSKQAGISVMSTAASIPKEMLGSQIIYLDANAQITGTDEQKARYMHLAENWNKLRIPNVSKGFSITWDEAIELVGKDIDTVRDKVQSLEDCLLYLTASGYQRTNGDLKYAAGKTTWHFNYSAKQVFEQNKGNCGGTAALINYLLDGKYDENGYIGMVGPNHTGGHVINYLKHNGTYYVFDVSQFASDAEYGLNLQYGLDFKDVVKFTVDGYNTYVMACAFSNCPYGDIPVGWDESSVSYIPSNYPADFTVLYQDEAGGNVYELIEVSEKDIAKMLEAKGKNEEDN